MKKNLFRYFAFPLLLLAIITGCTEDDIVVQAGQLPDEAAIGNIGSKLRSNMSFSGIAKLELKKEVDEPVLADEIYFKLSQPAQNEVKITVSIATEMSEEFQAEIKRQNDEIKAYNDVPGNKFPKPLLKPSIFPLENTQIEGGKTLIIPAGKDISQSVKLMLSAQELSSDYVYELRITVEQTNTSVQTEKQNLSYMIDVYQKAEDLADPFDPNAKVIIDDKFLTVFYVNTEKYQPLLADIFVYQLTNNNTFMVEGTYTIGNIVNLRTITIGYNTTTQRAILTMNSDIHYVLEHANTYIRPLQDHGRKVCLCIENGGKGLGFCNMNDNQIADLVQQIKDALDIYHIDGINLRDNGLGYGKEGMPSINTTSYPKFIKALREAMPDKLLTLEDKGSPTEYFYDTQLCGGIEVGKYIDYAWHGYDSDQEDLQIIEPWESEHSFSKYIRKPIAGLSPSNYGSVNIPLYPTSDESLTKAQEKILIWKATGRKKNNIVVFGNDLTANEQTKYEGGTEGMISSIECIADDGMYWGENPWPPFESGMQSGEYFHGTTQAFGHFEKWQSNYRYLAKNW